MKKSDFAVVGFIYLFVLFFAYQTSQLPEEAQSYPTFLLASVFALNSIYLAVSIWRFKAKKEFKDDLAHLYDGFIPKQFFSIAAGAVIYVALIHWFGYYIASVLYMCVALALLRVKAKWIAVVIVSLLVVIWLVFTLFLRVPLPTGILFD